MENVDNLKKDMAKVENLEKNIEASEKLITIKPFQGLNESNLMTLPFISLKRKKEPVLIRKWIKGNQEVGLKVVGGENGCPTMFDLDVLLALFRLLIKSIDGKYVLKENNKVDFPKEINFTYRKLAKEMGIKKFGGSCKVRLENSIKKLNEVTIYSTFAFRDQEEGKYIKTFKGERSCGILCKYKSYSVEERKVNKDKLASPKEIESLQSVEIDEFFYKNMCSNYFKLYDYIGIDITDKKDEYYYNNELKKSLDELKEVGFIKEYEFKVGEGILFIFNATQKIKAKGLDKYTTDADVIARLREIGISYEDINNFVKMDTLSYISAMLRYVDDRFNRGLVEDLFKYTAKGLPYGSYDVHDYEVEF